MLDVGPGVLILRTLSEDTLAYLIRCVLLSITSTKVFQYLRYNRSRFEPSIFAFTLSVQAIA